MHTWVQRSRSVCSHRGQALARHKPQSVALLWTDACEPHRLAEDGLAALGVPAAPPSTARDSTLPAATVAVAAGIVCGVPEPRLRKLAAACDPALLLQCCRVVCAAADATVIPAHYFARAQLICCDPARAASDRIVALHRMFVLLPLARSFPAWITAINGQAARSDNWLDLALAVPAREPLLATLTREAQSVTVSHAALRLADA
jgi:hypothetical protein